MSQQTVGVLSATSTPYSDLDPTSSNSHAQNPQVLPMSDDGGDVDIVNGEVSEQIFGAIPERLLIPSINLDSSVVELGWSQSQSDDGRIFSQWDVADHAAGWHLNSAKLGVGGNVVLSGHNNIYGAVFRELDQLKQGDEALLWANGDTYRYTIDKVLIVPETYATEEQRKGNAAWIGHFDDDRLTLVSCWPRDDNSHRIVVVAFAEESDASDSLSEGPTNRN
ncbi:MAG: sortase [Chloroflexota bacterium]